MTLSLQDLRLRQVHAEFERTARGIPDPLRMAVGIVRAAALITATAITARGTGDPMTLTPRVLLR